jgi:hypothetical protein
MMSETRKAVKQVKSLCGAPTSSGSTCRNPVSRPGERCYLHKKILSDKRILALARSAVEAVKDLVTIYEAIEKLAPLIAQFAPLIAQKVHDLHGLLMPEHFWRAFDERDTAAMQKEFDKAFGPSSKSVVARYNAYSEAEKLRVAEAYRQIVSLTARASRAARRKKLE